MRRATVSPVLRGLLLALLLSAGPPGFGAGTTPEMLAGEGHLEIDARLATTGTTVPGQKLSLNLNIATDRWFAGGTRITLPEVPGLVILQTEQFASNSSERRGDQSWVLQRWTLDIFPQRAGDFTIPPVTARVKVNAGDAGDIEGPLNSPPVHFTVALPAPLAGVPQWVAAPAFSVSQSFDRSLEGLQVGDAFERQIVFEASDVMAMMLPVFSPEEMPGLAAYPAPPVLDNSSNRGQTRASRRQRISYVAQAQGRYQLPAADFFWWDTTRGELQVLSLPATAIAVGAGGEATAGTGSPLPVTRRRLLLATAGLAVLAVLLWRARRRLPRVPQDRLALALAGLRRKIHRLRQPALPQRLNPGGTAGE